MLAAARWERGGRLRRSGWVWSDNDVVLCEEGEGTWEGSEEGVTYPVVRLEEGEEAMREIMQHAVGEEVTALRGCPRGVGPRRR